MRHWYTSLPHKLVPGAEVRLSMVHINNKSICLIGFTSCRPLAMRRPYAVIIQGLICDLGFTPSCASTPKMPRNHGASPSLQPSRSPARVYLTFPTCEFHHYNAMPNDKQQGVESILGMNNFQASKGRPCPHLRLQDSLQALGRLLHVLGCLPDRSVWDAGISVLASTSSQTRSARRQLKTNEPLQWTSHSAHVWMMQSSLFTASESLAC